MADSGLFLNRFDDATGRLLSQAEAAVTAGQPVVALGFIVRYLRAKRLRDHWDETQVADLITQVEAS
jgi:hypothetical protein